jgi:translation initiation factor 5
MALNVNRAVQDAFYRYKMPRLQAKVEGKGNGVKTVIPNMVEVARALGRPPTYPTKYFGCELGAQTQFDFKNDRYIVNGSHDAAKLQDMLDGFIKKFVLCENCDNPETDLKCYIKKGIITASCRACGHSYQLDMRHKLTTFILKNPPGTKLNDTGTSLTERKDKKSKRKQDEETNGGTNGNHDNNETINEDDNADDDDNWTVDVSEEAVKKRMKDLSMGVKGLAMDSDIEKTESERINILYEFVKAKVQSKAKLEVNDEKEIVSEAERLEVTNKAPIVLCELIFDKTKILAQIKSNKRLLLRFCHENQKAQKYLLGGIEKTIETYKDVLLPKTGHIFKAFYDEDILDEEVILEWGKKASKKYVSKELSEQIHKKAEPFLNWLKEAEEESSDEDDDEVPVAFDDRAKISTIKELPTNAENGNNKNSNSKESTPASKQDEDDDDEDDLDIDDI